MNTEHSYDREWVADVDPGRTQIRYGLTTARGAPVRFLVQLEYRMPETVPEVAWQPGEWCIVARFDHDIDGPTYRNVEAVGLHLDVLKPDGTQVRKQMAFPDVPLRDAIRYADGYLRDHHDFLIRRFEEWL